MIINNLLFLFFAIKNTLLEKKVCPKHTRTIYVYSYSLCFQGVNVFAIECIFDSLMGLQHDNLSVADADIYFRLSFILVTNCEIVQDLD